MTIGSFSCAPKCKLQPVECLTLIGTEGHAPEEAERLLAAQAIAGEADRMEKGLQEIRPAFYLETIAAKIGSFVDIDAPFAAPAAAE